jgi:hypothetical protein
MRCPSPSLLLALCAPLTFALAQCSSSSSPDEPAAAPPTGWVPGHVYPCAHTQTRGLLELRGIIHAHSVYSHDACDNQPRDDAGAINQACFDDLRDAMCGAKHDFVMLTDHPAMFKDTEFPEPLLYRPERGDRLVSRNNRTAANFAGCPNASPVLIMAGFEGGTMPVGLEGHAAADPASRDPIYNADTAEAITTLKAQGAVSLVAHTEDWTVDQLSTLPLDGFEMYNVHANLFLRAGTAGEMLKRLYQGANDLPVPALFIFPLVSEDPSYVDTWGKVLSRGVKRVTVMASDTHRNSFPQILSDGERVDSYRRIMSWFSNHLLVRPKADGTWDDSELKDALRAGRLFGVFEYLGYAEGFDYRAIEGADIREMGDTVSIAKGAELVASMPTMKEPAANPSPILKLRLLRATDSGWKEVTSSSTELRHKPTEPGVYRAEVRMTPLNLQQYLGRDAEQLAHEEKVWVYSNPIYVAP